MDAYSDITRTWWRYIDAILLKALPAPIPYIKNIIIDYGGSEKDRSTETLYRVNTYHYAVDVEREKYLESVVRTFFMDRRNEQEHFVSEITGKESDKNVHLAYGHYNEYEEFESLLHDKVLSAEIRFMNRVQKAYPEYNIEGLIHEVVPDISICKEIEEEIENKDSTPADDLYLNFYGSGELQHYASIIVRRYWQTLYEDLGLLERGAAYDLLTQGIPYVIEHYASKHDNEDRASSPEEYLKVYDYYMAYLFDYLKVMRPVIHRRMVRYNLTMSLDNLFEDGNPKKEKMMGDMKRIFDPESSDFQIMFRKPNIDTLDSVGILNKAIDALDKGKIDTFCPWAINLVRYKL